MTAALLVGCFSFSAYASDDDGTHVLPAVSGVSTVASYAAEDDGVAAISATEPDYLELCEDAPVEYSYQLTYYDDDEAHVGVDASFTISSGGEDHSFFASGIVDRAVLNDSITLIKGPLYGSFSANGIDYDFTAGFTKVEQGDAISIGLVLTSADYACQQLYSFGTPIMTEDVQSALAAYRAKLAGESAVEGAPVHEDTASPYAVNSLNYVFSNYGYGAFTPPKGCTVSGNGCRVNGFKEDAQDRIMVTLESYCRRFDSSKFPSGTFIDAYVDSYTIGLRRTGDACYIATMEEPALLDGSGSTTTSEQLNVIFAAAGSLLGKLPSPYNTGASLIINILKAVNKPASVSLSVLGNHSFVRVQTALGSELDFDSASIPVVFQLARPSGNTPMVFAGEGYGKITYLADLVQAAFYIPTEEASFWISMNM